MRIIGKIDLTLYKEVAPNITTDEVVLTDMQAQHVQERHPKAYERYLEHLAEILESPDFILCDPKHNNTALVIKRYINFAEVVLRLCTDDSGNKNSIITFWEIKEARLQRYLLTHKVLYKCE